MTDDPGSATATAARSARRTTVRATSSSAEIPRATGEHEVGGISKRPAREVVRSSTASTISGVTRELPGERRSRLPGAVASSAMHTYRSRSTATSTSSSSDPGAASARATPIAAWASSTAPSASGAGESLRTRPPYSRPVVPSSPLPVHTRMGPTLPVAPSGPAPPPPRRGTRKGGEDRPSVA
jgi:hypothetical protein